MLENLLIRIVDWFRDRSARSSLIRSFNDSANNAFITGDAPTLLRARISKGVSAYRHSFSDWLNSGFRIQTFSGRQLSRDEIKQIGLVILGDNILVRRLVVLGWDTLEIHGDIGSHGLRWQLKDYVRLPNE